MGLGIPALPTLRLYAQGQPHADLDWGTLRPYTMEDAVRRGCGCSKGTAYTRT